MRASFEALAAELPGQVALAVGPLAEQRVETFGSLQTGHAWSTMKVPVLVTVLSDLEAAGDELDPPGRRDAELAVRKSDNAAAVALFSRLEDRHDGPEAAANAVERVLHRGGDHRVRVNRVPNDRGFTAWGQTQWSNAGQVAFFRALARGALLSASHTSYVLALMASVVSEQRWGAGAAEFGAPVAFKGGWGPEAGWAGDHLVRQAAIVGRDEGGYVLSMTARSRDGSFEGGTMLLDRLAAWAAGDMVLAKG